MSISCGHVDNDTYQPWSRDLLPDHSSPRRDLISGQILIRGFYLNIKANHSGPRHRKLNFTLLIWLAITTTTAEAKSRDSPHYSSTLASPPPLPDTLYWASTPRHSCRLASRHVRALPSPLLLIFLLQHFDLNSCTIEKKDWHPSSRTKACIATIQIILVRNNKTKKKR